MAPIPEVVHPPVVLRRIPEPRRGALAAARANEFLGRSSGSSKLSEAEYTDIDKLCDGIGYCQIFHACLGPEMPLRKLKCAPPTPRLLATSPAQPQRSDRDRPSLSASCAVTPKNDSDFRKNLQLLDDAFRNSTNPKIEKVVPGTPPWPHDSQLAVFDALSLSLDRAASAA